MAEQNTPETADPNAPVAVPDATPAKPKVISPFDMMRAKNLDLELKNVALQLEIMQNNLKSALQTRGEIVARMNKLREEYLVTYGVDIARMQINEDGTFSPVPAGMPGMG